MEISITQTNECQTYLRGERIISIVLVDIPKYDLPILADTKKKIVTVKIDAKRRAQEVGSNMSARFQMGDVLAGYLEKK